MNHKTSRRNDIGQRCVGKEFGRPDQIHRLQRVDVESRGPDRAEHRPIEAVSIHCRSYIDLVRSRRILPILALVRRRYVLVFDAHLPQPVAQCVAREPQ